MAPFHTLSLAFAAAGAFATAAIEPQVCSGQVHCDQDDDLTSELQSVSLLQSGTFFVKAKESATLHAIAELTPSGEAVAVSDDEPSAEDETVSLSVPVDGVQQHVFAQEHVPTEEAMEASAELAAEPVASQDLAEDMPDAQLRKVPMVETIAAAHARRQTRRALPGVSLLGRMSAVVARHGVHAAHAAGSLPHVPQPHDEHADTLLVAATLLIFGAFSAYCVVLEHQSKDCKHAHAKQLLTSTAGGAAMDGVLKALPESLSQAVGAAVAVPSRGASFSVGLEVFAGRADADAFEVSDHTGLPFCTVTLSQTPAGARCLAVTCNEDEGRNCCVIAPPDAAEGLQVFGFKGKLHGVAQQDSGKRLSLLRDGQPTAVVEGLAEEPLQQTVFAPSTGEVLATSRRDPEAWAVRVEQGSDEVLSVVLLLARVLLLQDSACAGPTQESTCAGPTQEA